MISKQFGLIIKSMRLSKGIGLNDFASRIGVSPAYLSNLENGKTETVQLNVIDLLRQELQLNWGILFGEKLDGLDNHPLQIRLNVARDRLENLIHNNPEAAEYLISALEAGISYCMGQKTMPDLREGQDVVKPLLHH